MQPVHNQSWTSHQLATHGLHELSCIYLAASASMLQRSLFVGIQSRKRKPCMLHEEVPAHLHVADHPSRKGQLKDALSLSTCVRITQQVDHDLKIRDVKARQGVWRAHIAGRSLRNMVTCQFRTSRSAR